MRVKAIYPQTSFRVEYNVTVGAAHTTQFNIYRNGVAIGTDTGLLSPGVYTFNQDFTFVDFAVSDEIQIWGRSNVLLTSSVNYLRVKGLETDFIAS